MILNFHLPSYFSSRVRREIGELYAHSAVANMASSMMLLFEPIFFYAILKFSIPQVLLLVAVTYATYIVFIPLGGKFASNYGYKHAIAISIPFQIIYWMLLVIAQQNGAWAFAGAIFYGLSKTFYWPGFHSLMARYADQGQVGREFGAIYSLISLTFIAGPLIAGFLTQHFGFTLTFVITAIIYSFSILPLFRVKEIFVPKTYYFSQTWELYRQFPRKFLGYLGFGEELLVLNVWPIFIFIIVKNFEGTGALATVSSLAAAGLALLVGKITDQYSKRVLIKLGTLFYALIWLARFICTNLWNTFFVDALSRTSKEMVFIPVSTITYIRAEATHVVPYVVFFEQSLAIGKLSACLLGALLFSLTGSFMVLFVLGALYSLLYMLI